MHLTKKSLPRSATLLSSPLKNSFYQKQSNALIAFGANTTGTWGHPVDSIYRAIEGLGKHSICPMIFSRLYITPPLGNVRQPVYYNAVGAFSVQCGPLALLRRAKALERQAGRRLGSRWGPRPLDIDIIDFGGRVFGRPSPRRIPGTLTLPHPETARRGFVLMPICDIRPTWRHPVWGWEAKAYLARHPELMRGIKTIAWPNGPPGKL